MGKGFFYSVNVEVNGEGVLSIVGGMGGFKETALTILADHGIKNPQPGQWYPQQAFLDAFGTIAEKIGSGTLFVIGKAVPANALWPPQIDTIEKALASIDQAYHMNHRGGEIGSYRFELTGPKSGKMICHNPYPSDFDRGLIDAVAHKFAPPGIFPLVKLDETAPTRNKGANSCTFLITW